MNEITHLINQLKEQGSEAPDLAYLENVYETLPQDVQQKFLEELKRELAELKAT